MRWQAAKAEVRWYGRGGVVRCGHPSEFGFAEGIERAKALERAQCRSEFEA